MRKLIGHGDGPVQLALALLMVALPLAPALVPASVVLTALAVVRLRLIHRGAPWRASWGDGALAGMAAFYLLHVLGMAWTANTAFGAFDLEVKASFLLFPALAVLWPKDRRIDAPPLLMAFVAANVAAALLCIALAAGAMALELFRPDPAMAPVGIGHLFESRFSRFLHPSYMAMYCLFAMAVWGLGGAWRRSSRAVNVAVLFPLSVAVVLSDSKMGWITLAVLLLHAAWHFRQEPGPRRVLTGAMVAGLLLFAGLFTGVRTVRAKVLQALEATQGFDPASDRSSDLRRMTWSVGWDLLQLHPLTGVGTGDIKDELHAESGRRGYVHVVDKRLNAHSQFVQSGIALGWPGLLTFAAMLLMPLATAIRRRRPVEAAFFYLVLLNATVESLLEVQAGVVFLASFAFLFHLRHAPDPLRPATHR